MLPTHGPLRASLVIAGPSTYLVGPSAAGGPCSSSALIYALDRIARSARVDCMRHGRRSFISSPSLATDKGGRNEASRAQPTAKPAAKSIVDQDKELLERLRDREGGFASISDADSMGPMTSQQMFRILDQVRDGHRYSSRVRAVSSETIKDPKKEQG